MSYYHHGGEFHQDSNVQNDTIESIPSWETLEPQPQQQPQDSSSDSLNTFASPAAPTPHALPLQQFNYSPLHTPIDYGENTDFLFPTQQASPSMLMNFAPQERLVRSEGHPSPETEYYQPSPSPTTPTAAGPQRTTRSRGTVHRGTSGGSAASQRHQKHPYTRSRSALAGRITEHSVARYSVVAGGGIQSYPASMSAPVSEVGPSHSSPSSTMLPPLTVRPERPSLVSIPTSSHLPMGPPLEPSLPSPLPPPPSTQPQPAPTTILPPSATAPNVNFETTVRQIRAATKHFFTPRLDSFYDIGTHTLMACLELPGVRRENLYVTLANSAITRHRNVNIWGFSLSPNWQAAGATGTSAGASSISQEASSMTGTTTHMSSGSSSSTSNAPVLSTSAGEAAGTAHASSAPSRDGGSGGATDSRPLTVTSGMEMSLGLGLPPQYTSRERRYGEFFRILPVPPETRASYVQAILEAGVLTLFISFGPPLTEAQVSSGREVIVVR
ncbi:hypothetical protein J3R30DRAFT_1411695 [Lentinula aciculospora]|uniref:SHSP domain-containing protein n=1 Tax=Lentinula aciculospora TaxID=153920 RepID=A0A9W9ALT8_9AGAR|nr:hypothetical protein J3R30DRAFT_1411695 [Lentinula aciculospora]